MYIKFFSFVFSVFFLMFAFSCSDDGKNSIGEDERSIECETNEDCPEGYECGPSGFCESQDQGNSGFPDGGNTSGDTGDGTDDDDDDDDNDKGSGYGDYECDCFGEPYNIPWDKPEWCKKDEDKDGIPNCVDGLEDTDGDGVPNYQDTDSDGDGIPDEIEAPNGVPVDTDEDGTPDFLDTDSDGDGIPDRHECSELPCRDSDGDGVPDYRDTDSDGDGIPDKVECPNFDTEDGCVDTDSNGDPDYLDTDSDGDGIPDWYESVKDTDKDGIPNYLDTDSDGDGIPDNVECPDFDSEEGCVDTDGDGSPDYLDLDSDGDGVPDKNEPYCDNLGKSCRIYWDCNGNGFSDMVEMATGSDPCDPFTTPKDVGIDFYFELPWEGDEKDDDLIFSPSVKKADVFFNMDTTGSMGGEINNLKSSLKSTIIPQTRDRISDSAFGCAEWQDFPVCGFGSNSYGDVPFRLLQTPTTDINTAQSGVDKLTLRYGADAPESGYESLYQLATGVGTSWSGGSVPPYTGSGIGGVGFRDGSIPIALHITDATSHTPESSYNSCSDIPSGESHTRDETITELNRIGAKVITILSQSNGTAESQLTDISNSTGAVVPGCAGAGRTTLLYKISSDGSGLGSAVVNGIDALVKYATFSVYIQPEGDPDVTGFDTSCFIKKVESLEYIPADDCAATIVAEPAEFNDAGYNNGFTNFSTGTSNESAVGSRLKFRVLAENDECYEPEGGVAESFKVFLNIIDATTGSVLDTQEVFVIVPGIIDDGGSER